MANRLNGLKEKLSFYRTVQSFLYFFLSVIVISAPALFNGYPILYFDSRHYIYNSVNLLDFSTNPIGYPLFIRAFSWQYTLWPVVFAQSLLLSILLFFVVRNLFHRSIATRIHFFIITILALFTSMGWVASHIMADIFAPIAILAIYLAVSEKTPSGVRWFSFIVIFIAGTTHFSIVLIALVMMLFQSLQTLVFSRNRTGVVLKKLGLIFVPLLAAVLFVHNYHHFNNKSDKAKGMGHIILMARLMEEGILDDFLEDNCDDASYALCNFRNQFPNRASEFVWEKDSPFYKTGGWSTSKEEYNEIIFRIFTNPRYIALFAYKGLISTMKQLCTFRVIVLHISSENRGLADLIGNKFKSESKNFSVSRQHRRDFTDISEFNLFFSVLSSLSLLIIVLFLLGSAKNSEMMLLVSVLCFGIVSNAAVNGFISNVVPRYQARVAWLLVLVALILILRNWKGVRSALIYNDDTECNEK